MNFNEPLCPHLPTSDTRHAGVYALEVMGPQKVSSHLVTRRANNTFLVDGQPTGGSTDLCEVVAYLSKPVKGWPVVLREGLDKHGFTKGNRALLDFDSTLDEPSDEGATGSEGADSGGHHARVVEVTINKLPGKYFGLNFEDFRDGMSLLITEVLPGGLAAQEGQIQTGMLLVNINGQPVAGKDKREITNVLRALRGKTRLGVSHAPAEVAKPMEVEMLSNKDFLNVGLDFVSAANSSLAPKRGKAPRLFATCVWVAVGHPLRRLTSPTFGTTCPTTTCRPLRHRGCQRAQWVRVVHQRPL